MSLQIITFKIPLLYIKRVKNSIPSEAVQSHSLSLKTNIFKNVNKTYYQNAPVKHIQKYKEQTQSSLSKKNKQTPVNKRVKEIVAGKSWSSISI